MATVIAFIALLVSIAAASATIVNVYNSNFRVHDDLRAIVTPGWRFIDAFGGENMFGSSQDLAENILFLNGGNQPEAVAGVALFLKLQREHFGSAQDGPIIIKSGEAVPVRITLSFADLQKLPQIRDQWVPLLVNFNVLQPDGSTTNKEYQIAVVCVHDEQKAPAQSVEYDIKYDPRRHGMLLLESDSLLRAPVRWLHSAGTVAAAALSRYRANADASLRQ